MCSSALPYALPPITIMGARSLALLAHHLRRREVDLPGVVNEVLLIIIQRTRTIPENHSINMDISNINCLFGDGYIHQWACKSSAVVLSSSSSHSGGTG